MRKTLALVLSIVMVLSLAIVGVSAADATEIKTAAEFAAMAADGNYKLGADITIDTTYASDFTGTLDGNGHTVTVSAPMFGYMNGTVKNLTIKGEITSTETHVAPLALRGKGTITIENVTNEANVNLTNRGAGIISQIDNGSTVVIKNCVNKGNIISTGDSGSMLGGIMGYIQGNTLTMTDCVNLGKVSADKGNVGGLVGRIGGDYPTALRYIVNVSNCLNEGEVSSAGPAAGIVGYARGVTLNISKCTNKGNVIGKGSDSAGILASSNVTTANDVKNTGNSNINISYCVNEGNVETSKNRAAGICGYVWAGGGAKDGDNSVTTHVEIIGNVNKGNIKGTTHVSQIMAYTNSKDNIIKDNVGLGKVEKGADDATLAFYSFSSADIPAGMTGNKIVSDGTELYTYTATADKAANVIKIADMTAESGLAIVSAADAQAAVTALGAIGYKAPVSPINPPATGDAMVWVAVAAIVSVLGMGIAVKAKNN